MKEFKCPSNFTAQYIRGFLMKVSEIFKLENLEVPDVNFDTLDIKKIDLLGLVLLYKFFEYTVRKKCFKKPVCTLEHSDYVYGELKTYGFRDIVYDFINQKPADYKKLKSTIKDKVVVNPIFLDKNSEIDEVSVNSTNICTYYKQNKNVLFVILTCLGEIASNFRSHAVIDTQSILAASGSKEYFEIACADTGHGIISTLRPFFSRKLNYDIIKESVKLGVSSKDKYSTDHMGQGLWLVDQITSQTRGQFQLLSEGAYYINQNGKIRAGACSYWKGTIVYIKIPLKNIDTCIQFITNHYKKI